MLKELTETPGMIDKLIENYTKQISLLMELKLSLAVKKEFEEDPRKKEVPILIFDEVLKVPYTRGTIYKNRDELYNIYNKPTMFNDARKARVRMVHRNEPKSPEVVNGI